MANGPLSGATEDLFSGLGQFQAANAYSTASNIATANAALTRRSGDIQQEQEQRAIIAGIGSENASVAGAGFASGGSAGDLLRMSVQKGALDKQLLANQTEITAQGFEQQAAAYKGQEKTANAAGTGDVIGGVFKAVGWVICTELVRQSRMPREFWKPGAAIFAVYPKFVQEGYHVWAVPSVRHLRQHPHSLYSCLLCAAFNWRAENIAHAAGVSSARHLYRGAAITVILWPLCYAIGAVRRALNKSTDWKGLYRAEH